jgi:predicted TIM-barrel fold metal-dependent hydrolase
MTTRRSFIGAGLAAAATAVGISPITLRGQRIGAPAILSSSTAIPRGEIADWHTHWIGPRVFRLLTERATGPKYVLDSSGGRISVPAGRAAPPAGATPQASIWFDVDERVAHLDEVGVRTQLVSWVGASYDSVIPAEEARPLWHAHNEDVAELVRSRPGRFLGLATLPTADIPAAAAELDRAHRELGLIGATLPLDAFIHLESARALAPIFEVAQRHRSLIYIHRGRAAPTIPGDTPEVGPTNAWFGLPASSEPNVAVPSVPGDFAVARTNLITSAHLATGAITLALTDFLDPYPDVTVQMTMNGGSIAHLIEAVEQRTSREGLPDPTPRLRRLYYDTGSTGRGPRGIALAAEVIGADRILFGSDYGPWPSIEPFIEAVVTSGLTAEQRQLVYVENARSILSRVGTTD